MKVVFGVAPGFVLTFPTGVPVWDAKLSAPNTYFELVSWGSVWGLTNASWVCVLPAGVIWNSKPNAARELARSQNRLW